MNKYVPYVWRKNYCNDERRTQNFLKITDEKASQCLSRCAGMGTANRQECFIRPRLALGTRQCERQYVTFPTKIRLLKEWWKSRTKRVAEQAFPTQAFTPCVDGSELARTFLNVCSIG